MTPRIDYVNVDSNSFKAMLAFQTQVDGSGLEHSLLDLVSMRASQLNGCALCLDLHSRQARARGETEQRLYTLDAWRETPFYSERERAALAWTEAVTLVGAGHVADPVYEETRAQFDERELTDLTWAVAAINVWNRLCIAFRAVPGSYQPARKAA